MAGQASGEKPPRATSHAQKFRESEKEKKNKKARRLIRQNNLLVFKTVTHLQFGILFSFQLCFLIPLTGSWLL